MGNKVAVVYTTAGSFRPVHVSPGFDFPDGKSGKPDRNSISGLHRETDFGPKSDVFWFLTLRYEGQIFLSNRNFCYSKTER